MHPRIDITFGEQKKLPDGMTCVHVFCQLFNDRGAPAKAGMNILARASNGETCTSPTNDVGVAEAIFTFPSGTHHVFARMTLQDAAASGKGQITIDKEKPPRKRYYLKIGPTLAKASRSWTPLFVMDAPEDGKPVKGVIITLQDRLSASPFTNLPATDEHGMTVLEYELGDESDAEAHLFIPDHFQERVVLKRELKRI